MEISDRETIINKLLALPRTSTRNAPACSIETALKSLQLSEEIDYRIGRAYAYLSLGEYAMFSERDGAGLDQSGSAYSQFIKAKKIFAELADAEGCMLANLYIGVYLSEHARLPEAELALNEAMDAPGVDESGALYGNVLIDAVCGMASIRVSRQKLDEAGFLYEKALGYCSEKRNEAKRAGVLYRLGIYDRLTADNDKATRRLSQAVDAAVRDGEFRTAAEASRALAHIYFSTGRYEQYERYTELASRYTGDASREEAVNEIKNLRSYYVKENARVIANAEQHLKERLFERSLLLEEANWQLNTIYNIGQSITALLDIDEVLRTLYAELRALMDLDKFFIAAYNEVSNSLEYQILYEDERQTELAPDDHLKVPAGDPAYWCVYKDNTLVIGDMKSGDADYREAAAYAAAGGRTLRDAEILAAKTGSSAVVGVMSAQTGTAGYEGAQGYDAADVPVVSDIADVPVVSDIADADGVQAFASAVYTRLRTKGKLIGVLCVQSKKTHAYSSHQVKLLDAISSYVSIALDNAMMYQKLDEVSKKVAELANHDTLTGIPNRRLLLELVPKAYANALRTNSKVAFLFMDLDNFKPINDKYGHQAGDDVLKIFKERVLGLIRSTDIFARMGGDEFVVVMTDLKISSNAGTLARKIIRETSKPINICDTDNYIGVSIGISIYPDDSKDTDVLIVMADEAMYRVKRENKNSFTFFNEFIE